MNRRSAGIVLLIAGISAIVIAGFSTPNVPNNYPFLNYIILGIGIVLTFASMLFLKSKG